MTLATSRSPVGGRRLLMILVAIALGTVVLPPAGAWRLNRSRVGQTTARASSAAERVKSHLEALTSLDRGADVVCGPGRLPKPGIGAEQEAWFRKAVVAPSLFGSGMPTDAWGQCFLMNVGDVPRGGRVWIISAGPNGMIDTPLGASAIAGDDIGAIVK